MSPAALARAISQRPRATQVRFLQGGAARRELAEEVHLEGCLAAEARRRKLHERPAVAARLRAVLRSALLRQVRDAATKQIDNDALLRPEFERTRSRFESPARRRVAMIALSTKEAAAELHRSLRAMPARERRREFRRAVHTKSVDPVSKQRGGDSGYFELGSARVSGEIQKVAFELAKRGDLAKPLKSGAFWWVVMLEGKREARSRTFEQAKPILRMKLQAKAVKAAIEKLRDEARSRSPLGLDDDSLAAAAKLLETDVKAKKQHPKVPLSR